MHTKTPSVIVQGNITAVRYRNDVIWSVLLHIRANLGMMLARDYASCHSARSTLVLLLANNMQKRRKSGFKSYRPFVGPIETQVSCTATATKSQGAHACYSSECAVIPQQYIHRQILSMSSRYLAVDHKTQGGCIKYWNDIRYDAISFCSFCFKGVYVIP